MVFFEQETCTDLESKDVGVVSSVSPRSFHISLVRSRRVVVVGKQSLDRRTVDARYRPSTTTSATCTVTRSPLVCRPGNIGASTNFTWDMAKDFIMGLSDGV